jgi:putative aldouronate transport system permease protein
MDELMNNRTQLSKRNLWFEFKRTDFGKSIKTYKSLYVLLFFCIAYVIVFWIVPTYNQLFYSFVRFTLFGENKFAGLDIFKEVLKDSDFQRAFKNTVMIGLYNICFSFPIPIILSLMLNEMLLKNLKRIVQTIIVIPNFISWVVVAGLFVMVLSPENGPINEIIKLFGKEPVGFMTNEKWFRSVIVFTGIWKSSGYGTIIYLAAISSVDPGLYEAAIVDGAKRLRQVWHITLPCIRETILIVFLLQISGIFGIFDPVLIMYSPLVYSTGDVLGTYIYRVGLLGFNISEGTVIGLFGSAISFIIFEISNFLTLKTTGHRLM